MEYYSMPKGTNEVTKGGVRVRTKCRTKFKLGNRKSIQSALSLSSADLVALLKTANPKDTVTISQVLTTRQLNINLT